MSSRSRSLGALALLCLSLGLAVPRASAAPQVVASILPLHALASAVMEGVGSPRLLLRGGESPHSFSLRPSDARGLQHADILFWIGAPLERPLERVLPNLDRAQAVAMLDAPGVQRLPMRRLDADPHDGPGHDPDHHHDDTVPDPHIWLSPVNAIAMSGQIARVLIAHDPANAARYRANAAGLRDRLQALDSRLAEQFAGVEGHYAVFHDAYQYLEKRYGLRSSGTVTTHPERGPGAAHLKSLRARLIADDVRCLFSEPQFQARLVDLLREGLAVRHAVLDPLGADVQPGAAAYEVLMQSIADRFTQCMQGATTP